MSLGPFDLAGGPFLILYGALFAATLAAGFVIPRRLRPAGQRQRVTDVDQLAFLAGGGARFGDAVVARLLAARTLVMTGKDSFAVRAGAGGAAASAAERQVLALPAPMRWREIKSILRACAEPLEQRMVAAGLLVGEAERRALRLSALLPYALLLAFGATKWAIGIARDRPVGFLTALLVATALCAAIRWFTLDRRTQAGIDAVADAAVRARRLRAAPASDEIGLAVALFGTAVLAGSGWAEFHRLRSAGGGDSGTGGDGGGGGCGGGGGGGGCGGCGS